MFLEDAIQHLEESLNDEAKEWSCEACKAEHQQLLAWLKELREWRSGARRNMSDEDIKRAYDELRAKRMAMI